MKEDLNMSFRKVDRGPVRLNSEINLLLRQQWALSFLSFNETKKVILNIDETWLDFMDFRRRKWQVKGRPNSILMKAV